MSDIKQAQLLMRMANKDYDALIGMAQNSKVFADEFFGFHAQQAIEKALKAWICMLDISYPLSHQIARLLTILENSGENIEAFWPLEQYTAFAVQARYEAGIGVLTTQRATVIEEVRLLLDRVTALVTK
jgi:HEPN domain-containing protein